MVELNGRATASDKDKLIYTISEKWLRRNNMLYKKIPSN